MREVHKRVTRKHANVQIARFQADQQAALAGNQLSLAKLSIEERALQYRSALSEQQAVLARTEEQAGIATQYISRLDREVKARKNSENAAIRLLSAAVSPPVVASTDRTVGHGWPRLPRGHPFAPQRRQSGQSRFGNPGSRSCSHLCL